MKRLMFIFAMSLLTGILLESTVMAQLRTPILSPRQTITQVVGIADVTIDYSRPSIRGRKIMGGLVPFNEVWRTGANASTKISFSEDVMLNGNKVAAGEYAIFTIPTEKEWTFILSDNLTGGASYPGEANDVTRFVISSKTTSETVESFTISITDLTPNSANVCMAWENTVVEFKMEFDIDTKIMADIDEEMKDMQSRNAQLYQQAAGYYFNNGKDLNKSLEWINKAIELNGGPFFVLRTKSQIQAALKDYKGAIKTAELSMKKAKEVENEQFVKFNEEAIAEWKKMME